MIKGIGGIKMFDVVALGEILIDFSPYGKEDNGFNIFTQNPGGAPINLAATISSYGGKSAYIGKVGNDMFGIFLKEQLSKIGVDCSGIIFDKQYNTTLAFVALNDKGDRDFNFYRKNEADIRLSPSEVSLDLINNCRIFHFGGLSMTEEPSRSATLFALEKAKQSGCIISFDPNYRKSLWENEDLSVKITKTVLNKVDLLKISEEEARMLTSENDLEVCCKKLLNYGISFIALTLGDKGAMYATKNYIGYSPAYIAKTIDTTGAGDIFWGTFIHEYLKYNIDIKDKAAIESIIIKANKAAGLSTEKKGAIPSIPEYSIL
ncbi:MAG: sugar kinase, ribokinase [Clostridia bacterium]|nr:sugar kinase, ribokinase [Clostridia bacterium]